MEDIAEPGFEVEETLRREWSSTTSRSSLVRSGLGLPGTLRLTVPYRAAAGRGRGVDDDPAADVAAGTAPGVATIGGGFDESCPYLGYCSLKEDGTADAGTAHAHGHAH